MNDLFLHRWTPELRRAVLRTCPDFFRWPADQQSRYRVRLPEEERQAICAILLERLRGDDAGSPGEPIDEDTLPLPLQNRLNELLQPLVGIGEDAFSLNEMFDEGVTIFDFPTLGVWDEHEHAVQQRLRAEHDSVYEAQAYRGNLYAHWARVMIDGRIAYLTLSMAAGAICERIQEASADELQRRIPHRYVRGRHDGEVEGNLIRWDSRIEADGQEALLEELQHRVWSYEQERWRALAADWVERGIVGAYVIDGHPPEYDPDERNLAIVFTDPQALGRVRFESFLADTRRIQRPSGELDRAVTNEIDLLNAFIAEQHEDLLRNFNPKIARLRKRTRIMMHPQAFDALGAGNEDPD
jgi:hypothetical protein